MDKKMKKKNKNIKKLVFSDGSSNFLSNPNPKLKESVTFSIRVSKKVTPSKVFLSLNPKGEVFFYSMQMTKEDKHFKYYTANYIMGSKKLIYKFYLIIDNKEYFYTAYGLYDYEIPDIFSFTLFADCDYSSWTPESIFYQIFPDRFNRVGETKLDDREYSLKVDDKVYHFKKQLSDWNDPIIHNHFKERIIQFYGGNFNGIRNKIPYLKELGINAIYLTPIFKARSNHRYDIEDYLKPDPLLGTEEDLALLIDELHKNGIKIIFDAVLNHTGVNHEWFDMFNEHKKGGAFLEKGSQFRDYYYFNEESDHYESWMDCKILPQLNLTNRELIDKLLNNDNSAIKKWLSPPFNIDGWRMDTASILGKYPVEQIDLEFTKELHKAIKSVNEDGYIMGETFYDPKQLVDIDRYEATMNYRCSMTPLKKWLTGLVHFMTVPKGDENQSVKFSAKKVLSQMRFARVSLPFQNQIRMYNLLNSHDTARFWTLLKKDYNKLKIALTILFTYIGIPSLYYGDEIGLEGENDPDCRRTMIWDEKKHNTEINKLYKSLINLRKSNKTLVYGSIIELYDKKNVVSYLRFLNESKIIVICNGDKSDKNLSISLESVGIENQIFKDFYTKREFKVDNFVLNIELKGEESLILIGT